MEQKKLNLFKIKKMKTKKYYTTGEIEAMEMDELRELVEKQQTELDVLRWSVKETRELLIAALQSLPKMLEL